MRPDNDTASTPAVPADLPDPGRDDDSDLDPAGAPCLVCGQTVPGPRRALLCPDCTLTDHAAATDPAAVADSGDTA